MSAARPNITTAQQAQGISQSLPPMLVQAERVAATVMLGVHGRRRAGPGENFWQYRHYGSGDSTQRIDWHKSARADQIYIREKEWEAANTLWLWSNTNARMNFKSHLAAETKLQRAELLQLAMASLAVRAHERIGTLGSPRRAGTGQLALRQMAEDLASQPNHPLPSQLPTQRQSAAVLFSDFLDEPELITRALAPLAQSGVRGHLVQITDPAEEALPYNGRVEFLGLDLPARFLSNKTQDLRADYITAFKAQRESVRQIANRLGWSFTVHHTSEAPLPCLQALYLRVSDK